MARKKKYQRLTRAEETVVRDGILRFLFAITTFAFRDEGMPKFIRTLALANKNERPFTAQKAIDRIVRTMADKKLLKLEFGKVTSPNLKHKRGQIVTGVVLTAAGAKVAGKLGSTNAPVAVDSTSTTQKQRTSMTRTRITSSEEEQQDQWLMTFLKTNQDKEGRYPYLVDIIDEATRNPSSPFFGRSSTTIRRTVKRLAVAEKVSMISAPRRKFIIEPADTNHGQSDKEVTPPTAPLSVTASEDETLKSIDAELSVIDSDMDRLRKRRDVLLEKKVAYTDLKVEIRDLLRPTK